MGLDEAITQICPVPAAWHWLSDSGGKGIQVCAVVHGEAQLTGQAGVSHGRQVADLDTSSVKSVPLPGITDTTTCRRRQHASGAGLIPERSAARTYCHRPRRRDSRT